MSSSSEKNIFTVNCRKVISKDDKLDGIYKIIVKDENHHSWIGTTPSISFFSSPEECSEFLEKYGSLTPSDKKRATFNLPFAKISLVNLKIIETYPCFGVIRIDSRYKNPRVLFHHGMQKILEDGSIIPRLFQYKPRIFSGIVMSCSEPMEKIRFILSTSNIIHNSSHLSLEEKEQESDLSNNISETPSKTSGSEETNIIFHPSRSQNDMPQILVGPHQSLRVQAEITNVKEEEIEHFVSFVTIYSLDSFCHE